MSLRYEMGIGVPSTYGKAIAEKPRDMQAKQKSDKPILKVKRNG